MTLARAEGELAACDLHFLPAVTNWPTSVPTPLTWRLINWHGTRTAVGLPPDKAQQQSTTRQSLYLINCSCKAARQGSTRCQLACRWRI